MKILISETQQIVVDVQDIEFVERKGIGHPDSLCDGIAEAISSAYSEYGLKHFGVVPNHWVDKCMLIGGECERGFGSGKILSPLTVFVVGKMTHKIENFDIPVEEICKKAICDYLATIFDLLDPVQDIKINLFTNSAVGAGRRKSWYRPHSLEEFKNMPARTANDAVICSGYAPLSRTEKIVLELERFLNSKDFKKNHPEIGTDIKVIGQRHKNLLTLTLCIPFIAQRTPSRAYYESKKEKLQTIISEFVNSKASFESVEVHINTRDDEETIYMTHLGSAADTGDVGVVGRGNRLNGLITPAREMSIEAPCGKNPIYHTGKIYAVLSQRIADCIYNEMGIENSVSITSETGTQLETPHFVAVKVSKVAPEEELNKIVIRECSKIKEIQNVLIKQLITLF